MNKDNKLKNILLKIATIIIFIYFTFPLFWMFWTSIKPRRFSYDPGKWIFKPSLSGYVSAITNYRIPEMALNSFIISIVSTLLALFIGTIAAYSIVRSKSKYKKGTLIYFLVVRFIPPISLILPLFLMGKFFNLLDTKLILVLAYQILCISFTVLMMKGFLQNVPEYYEEAAMLEGCSRFKAFFLVTLPLIQNGLFATGTFLLLYTWNEFPYALFLTNYESRTLPTAVQFFLSTQGVDWNSAMAYSFMSVLPILIIAGFFRKYMVKGLTFGLSK